MTTRARSSRSLKWVVALLSLCAGIAIAETLLRYSLFHTTIELAAKDPAYYARTLDELWVYRYLFSPAKGWAVAPGQRNPNNESAIEFYRKWATSLVPDKELGYVRAADIRTPCHETTHLATRGTREYPAEGSKIVFLGDSFVESAACSGNTLTTKLERLTGIDTLNYGVGGYGVDQIYLYLKRILPAYDRSDCLILLGLIQDDLDRVLLAVRTSPKPYFTVRDGALLLHTEHIHAASLNDYYRQPPQRFYLYYFLRGRLGYPVYDSLLKDTRELRRNAVFAVSELMFKDMARLARQGKFKLAVVVFPTPGNPFDHGMLSLIRAQGIPVADLQGCMTGRPDTELYAELHPTSAGNDMLANCLARDLSKMGLLPASAHGG